jgi:hypothetical protein
MSEADRVRRYALSHYRDELSRLLPKLGRGPVVHFCDCGLPDRLRRGVEEEAPQDPVLFGAILALECTLLAGVHAHAPRDHDRYLELVGAGLLIDSHEGAGVVHPHLVLSILPPGEASAALVEAVCGALLPAWAQAYDRGVSPGGGVRVLERLGRDGHVAANPFKAIDRAVHAAFVAGLRNAAAEVAHA